MRREDKELAKAISARLSRFEANVHPLPGVDDSEVRQTFVFQIIESVRRIRFVKQVSERPISQRRKDPASEYFDPVRAAILFKQEGELDEASWLVFLFVHFGRNAKSGYRLIADVYGRLGHGRSWTWKQVAGDPSAFRQWLDKNQKKLKTTGNVHRGFGNHRKYQSLDAWKPAGTGDAVQSYAHWVTESGGHAKLFARAIEVANGDPEVAFAHLYASMGVVKSFGRTAKFDYLAMIGKLGLASIRPDSVHFDGATGPVIGAQLLFRGQVRIKSPRRMLESLSDSLAVALNVDKQVVEDSLCNWQKSPAKPRRFRG